MFDPDPATWTAAPETSPAGPSRFVQRLRARATRDYATIRAALGDQLPEAQQPSRDEVLAEIASHVWLQAQIDGKWIDLDPAFADATVGKSFCAAEQVVDKLPDDYFQQVTIRIIVEKLNGTALEKETVLEVTRPVVDLLERQIFLVHSPQNGVGQAIAGQKDLWMPCLWIDGEVLPGKTVQFNDSAQPAGGAVGSVLDAFGTPAATPATPRFVAETLEFELTFPGGRHETTRRVLADCAGAAWRRTQPLDATTLQPLERDDQGVVAAQSLQNIWISSGRHDMPGFVTAIRTLANAAQASNTSPPNAAARQPPSFGLQVWPIAMQNLFCVLWADHVFVPALNSDAGVRFYTDSPRILLFSMIAHKAATQSEVEMEFDTDLRRDTVRGVAKDPAAGAAVARGKIWYGVLEGALEHEIAAREAGIMGDKDTQVSSTSALFDDRGAVVLRQTDAGGSWETLAKNRETAARLADAVSASNVLVVPKGVLESDGDSGWWAISPTTGDTRAVYGPDTNGSVYKPGGGRFGGGSSGPSINYVDEQGNRLVPKRSKAGGGSEYATLLSEISIPGAAFLGTGVGKITAACALAATAALAYYDFH